MSRKRRRIEDGAESQTPGSLPRRVWNQFGTLLIAILLALSVRSCVIEPYRIPSGSMFPTLLVGDHLFVNKFVYGIKIPLTDWRLPGFRGPERGDVVVFTVARGPNGQIFPADTYSAGLSEQFVKRVIGLPGDRVEVREGSLSINGDAVATVGDGAVFTDDVGRELRVLEEALPGRSHLILDDPRKNGPASRDFEIEEGRYFMMGDNRDYSNDSRSWGTVRLAEMKGPAFVIYWSWDWKGGWGELLNPLTWWDLLTDKTRWQRTGDRIQ